MSVDSPPPSERPEGVPFKVSPELEKVIAEMNEDEKVVFARAHGFKFKSQTIFGAPDKYVVVRERTDQEIEEEMRRLHPNRGISGEYYYEPQYEIRVRDLTIDLEYNNIIQKNDEELKVLVDRYHTMNRIISGALDEEQAKSLIRRNSKLIKKLEEYLLSLIPEYSKRNNARVMGDRLSNYIYDCHVEGKPPDKKLLAVYQKDSVLAFQQAINEFDRIEKDLTELGIMIPKPKVKSTHPYR